MTEVQSIIGPTAMVVGALGFLVNLLRWFHRLETRIAKLEAKIDAQPKPEKGG